ncbi:hypothetical protein GY45DRAFT_1124020 [Cubamyces sp. BRFM 1775]|nr:hypothetical protein GY45DRAFT_1124020 [Cubamyces sp. BRFM 1775]
MLFRLIKSIPTLDALYLWNVGDHETHRSSVTRPLPSLPPLPYITVPSGSWFRRRCTPLQPNLRVLSIVGRRRTRDAVFGNITSLLKSSGLDTSHLRSLDLRVGSNQMGKPRVQVPSFAPQLTHFGVVVRDLTENSKTDCLGREHMRRVFVDLPQCSRLRSLCLQYNGYVAFANGRGLHTGGYGAVAVSRRPSGSSFFLLELSEFLAAPGVPPLPHLETLSLVFFTHLDWLSRCTAEFERLAQACLGRNEDEDNLGERRYPRFARLEIQMMVSEMLFQIGPKQAGGARARFITAKERILPMFTSFTQAGVQVEISWVDRMYKTVRD